MDGVKLSELCKELGIDAKARAKLLKSHLAHGDWYRAEGVRGRPVMLTDSGEVSVRIFAEVNETEPQLVPNYETLQVLGQCPNPRWVYANRNGERVAVAIPLRLQGRFTRGKSIRVEVVEDATGVSFRHELLSTY